jgi:nucleotide-binding universal stress UspA family protein
LAAIELLRLAESHSAVLVTGTAARTGLDRILIGSVSSALAAAAPCAVPAGAALQSRGRS